MISHLRSVSLALGTIIFSGLICSAPLREQDHAAQPPSTISVPLIRHGGVVRDASGVPLPSQTVGVAFSVYKETEGGVALWHKVRNISTDANGQYNILLGSTMAEGVPVELFADQPSRSASHDWNLRSARKWRLPIIQAELPHLPIAVGGN